jgi:hypothetical protein
MTNDAVMTLAQTHLSFRARAGHLALLLAAGGMGTVIAALLLTEPVLPQRAVIAFWVMLGISAAWVAYAAWVLTARKTMLANHRVVAGRIGVAATTIFTLGASVLGVMAQMAAAYVASLLGLVLLALALLLLLRAQKQHQTLLVRRRELEARQAATIPSA